MQVAIAPFHSVDIMLNQACIQARAAPCDWEMIITLSSILKVGISHH